MLQQWADWEVQGIASIMNKTQTLPSKMLYLFKPFLFLMSGMSLANDLVLSNVIHKAFVEVNEEGTEAAAATAAVVSVRSIEIPVNFHADHPFLFFIRHNPSRSVLFAGRYCSPE